MQIPKTAETEALRVCLHRALTMAALAAWEGDVEAAQKHAATAWALANESHVEAVVERVPQSAELRAALLAGAVSR